jgi:hypothetical protein
MGKQSATELDLYSLIADNWQGPSSLCKIQLFSDGFGSGVNY